MRRFSLVFWLNPDKTDQAVVLERAGIRLIALRGNIGARARAF
jgi:hypothetical protein